MPRLLDRVDGVGGGGGSLPDRVGQSLGLSQQPGGVAVRGVAGRREADRLLGGRQSLRDERRVPARPFLPCEVEQAAGEQQPAGDPIRVVGGGPRHRGSQRIGGPAQQLEVAGLLVEVAQVLAVVVEDRGPLRLRVGHGASGLRAEVDGGTEDGRVRGAVVQRRVQVLDVAEAHGAQGVVQRGEVQRDDADLEALPQGRLVAGAAERVEEQRAVVEHDQRPLRIVLGAEPGGLLAVTARRLQDVEFAGAGQFVLEGDAEGRPGTDAAGALLLGQDREQPRGYAHQFAKQDDGRAQGRRIADRAVALDGERGMVVERLQPQVGVAGDPGEAPGQPRQAPYAGPDAGRYERRCEGVEPSRQLQGPIAQGACADGRRRGGQVELPARDGDGPGHVGLGRRMVPQRLVGEQQQAGGRGVEERPDVPRVLEQADPGAQFGVQTQLDSHSTLPSPPSATICHSLP